MLEKTKKASFDIKISNFDSLLSIAKHEILGYNKIMENVFEGGLICLVELNYCASFKNFTLIVLILL